MFEEPEIGLLEAGDRVGRAIAHHYVDLYQVRFHPQVERHVGTAADANFFRLRGQSQGCKERSDDALVELTASQGIAYVPYFPLGGFSPLQSSELQAVADRLGATPMAVALAWLLHRSPNMLLIPGTSSVAHLRENVAGAGLKLPADAIEELDAIG